MAPRDISFTQIVAVGGGATIPISSGAQEWTVTQVSTECEPAAPVGATCRVRKNGAIVSKMLPNGDVASGDPPVILNVGDVMTVVWTGMTVGTACKATVLLDDGT